MCQRIRAGARAEAGAGDGERAVPPPAPALPQGARAAMAPAYVAAFFRGGIKERFDWHLLNSIETTVQ